MSKQEIGTARLDNALLWILKKLLVLLEWGKVRNPERAFI